jgi:hypothetical protein
MNQFFLYWVDLFAMVSSIAISIYFLLKIKSKATWPLRSLVLFFVVFGPVVIAVHMSLHIIEISYHAITNAFTGTFKYNFRFYSLQLMGALILYLSIRFLEACRNYLITNTNKKEVLKTAGWIALISIPTIPLTPIGSLPAMACVISLVASIWVHKKQSEYIIKEKAISSKISKAADV